MKKKEYFEQFNIRYGSLALGKHQMKVEINDVFFEKYKNNDIKNGDIQVDIIVEKKETMVSLEFDIQGYIISFCDVCLEDLTIPISKQEMLILKITDTARENNNENIIFVEKKEYFYNIEQLLYEYIVTFVPIRKVHQEIGKDSCNPDMLKRIEEAKSGLQNIEDERWKVLKEITFE